MKRVIEAIIEVEGEEHKVILELAPKTTYTQAKALVRNELQNRGVNASVGTKITIYTIARTI